MKVVSINPPHAAIGGRIPDDHPPPHWIEVVDAKGFYPVKLLGPYATASLANRAQRGVMRLLNVARYTVAVVSQQDLEARKRSHESTS